MQTDGLKYIKWLSSHRQAYGFSPRIYNWREMGGRFDNGGKVFVNPNNGTVFVKNKKLKGGD